MTNEGNDYTPEPLTVAGARRLLRAMVEDEWREAEERRRRLRHIAPLLRLLRTARNWLVAAVGAVLRFSIRPEVTLGLVILCICNLVGRHIGVLPARLNPSLRYVETLHYRVRVAVRHAQHAQLEALARNMRSRQAPPRRLDALDARGLAIEPLAPPGAGTGEHPAGDPPGSAMDPFDARGLAIEPLAPPADKALLRWGRCYVPRPANFEEPEAVEPEKTSAPAPAPQPRKPSRPQPVLSKAAKSHVEEAMRRALGNGRDGE